MGVVGNDCRDSNRLISRYNHPHPERLKHDRKDFFDHYSPEARAILEELLEKYARHGTAQFVVPDILKVPPISERDPAPTSFSSLIL